MARGRFQPQRRDVGKTLRINNGIRSPQVRLIDENEEQVGVIATEDAKRKARAAGLDLVEVAPNSDPPVCRIMDYGKWKYQQRKKEQKNKSHAKQSELKELRLRPKTDDHDLMLKREKAIQFLGEGHKVQFTMMFRGREMAHRDIGMRILMDMYKELELVSKIETRPRNMGRRMTMVLAPDRKSKSESEKAQGEKSDAKSPPAKEPVKEPVKKAPPKKEPVPQG